MSDYKTIWLIIDYEGDVACAAETEVLAQEIVTEAAKDGGDYHIEETYLFSGEN